MTPTTRERIFPPQPSLRVPPADGLITTGAGAAGMLMARLAGRIGGETLWWTPCARSRWETTALRTAEMAGVSTVTASRAGIPGGRLTLACAFALHLAELRARRGLARTVVTAADPPHPPTGVVRLPHLVATTPEPTGGVVTDVVVWELMPTADVSGWLGAAGTPAAAVTVEALLPQLLRLRAAARAGRLPDTPAGRHLAALLTDRYLSVLLVYQHVDLIHAALSDLDKEATPA